MPVTEILLSAAFCCFLLLSAAFCCFLPISAEGIGTVEIMRRTGMVGTSFDMAVRD
jgi:hypothetical protein